MHSTSHLFHISPITAQHIPISDSAYTKERIIDTVCRAYSIPVSELMGKVQKHRFTTARNLCMWFMHHQGMNDDWIAEYFNKERTAALRARTVIYNLIATSSEFNELLRSVQNDLQ